MDKQNVIKYAKIGVFIGATFLVVRFVIKQVKLRKLKEMFGNYKTLTDNNKGNVGGVTLPQDRQDQNWSPRASAEALRDSMKGWGWTDEQKIFNTLDALDNSQRQQVRAYYNTYFGNGETLFEWFEGDLSGDDLYQAKAYFNN